MSIPLNNYRTLIVKIPITSYSLLILFPISFKITLNNLNVKQKTFLQINRIALRNAQGYKKSNHIQINIYFFPCPKREAPLSSAGCAMIEFTSRRQLALLGMPV